MVDWFVNTLRTYPEIAIFLSLALGYYFGSFTYKGLGLGAVTATLIAAVIIGQLGITISPPLKATFFLMFLFAIGYGVGPQFVRGIAKDGLPQALFAAVVCVFCLGAPYIAAKIAGYDVGSALGLYAGSQTISASMGLGTDAINRLGLAPEETKRLLDAMPVAYAVTYIFGTIGSAIVLALIGPALMGIDLEAECKRYEAEQGGKKETGGAGTAWHHYELRAYRVREGGPVVGKTAHDAESMIPEQRVFIERIRRGSKIEDATADTVIQAGDVVAVAGRRDVLVSLIGHAAEEVDDRELLAVPVEGVDVLVTAKEADGKTLAELAQLPSSRGVFLRRIARGATATEIPILPNTQIHRGDILTIVGRTQDTAAAAKALGVADRPSDVADVAFIGAAIAIGALIGALVYKIGDVPFTLSTSGGSVDLGALLRLAALRAAEIRTNTDIDGLVHEFGRPQCLHRRSRHLLRPRLRCRPAAAWIQPVPLGHIRNDRAAGTGNVCREICVPVPPRHSLGVLLRCAHDDCLPWHDQRSRQEPDPRAGLYRYLCCR